jgi:hypothetical protein
MEKKIMREERCKSKFLEIKKIAEDQELKVIQTIKIVDFAIASASVVDDVDPSAHYDVIIAALTVIKTARCAEKSSLLVAMANKKLIIAKSNCILTSQKIELVLTAQKMVQDAHTIYDAEILEITTIFKERLVKYEDIVLNYKRLYEEYIPLQVEA